LGDLIRAASGRVDAVRVVSSALNPLLWLTGLVTLPSLAAAFWTVDLWKSFVFFGLAIFPVGMTAGVYLYFMIRDPDRIQSEDYRIRKQAFKVILRRGANTEIVGAAKDIARIEKLEGAIDAGDRS
jgi:hypothetical protein